MTTIIQTSQLNKHYQQGPATVRAVDEVTMQIEAGQFVVITGRSGSGKTTLLSLVGGLTQATSGTLNLFGTDITMLDDAALSHLRGARMGFVFQFPSLIPTLNVFDNLRLPGLFGEQSADVGRIDHLLGWVGLADRKASFPSQLSGGQQARVALARALVNRPALLLADEPTGNLDVETETEIFELLKEINQTEETTIMLVTHNPAKASYGHRHLVMMDGQLSETQRAGAGAAQ